MRSGIWAFLAVCGVAAAQTSGPVSPVSVRLNIQTAQSGILTSVAVSNDGKLAAVSSMSGTLTLWDLETTRQLRRLTGTKGPVWSVQFDQTGTRAVASVLGSEGRALYVWDVNTGKAPTPLPGSDKITAFAYGCENSPLWAAEDGVIRRTDHKTGLERQFPGQGSVGGLAESPDCKQIVSGLEDGSVILWPNVWRAKPRVLRAADKDTVLKVAYSPLGDYFAAGSGSGRVWLFQSNGTLAATFLTKSDIKGLAFSGDGKFLLAAPEFKKTQVWDVQTKQLAGEIGSQGELETGLAVQGDRAYISSAIVEIWSISERKLLGDLSGVSESVSAAAFSPDMHSLATGSDFGGITVWDLTTGAPTISFATSEKRDVAVGAIGFAKDSKSVIAVLGPQIAQYDFNGQMLNHWPKAENGPAAATLAVETPDKKGVLAAPGGTVASFFDTASMGSLVAEMGIKQEVESPDAARWLALTGQPFPGMFSRMKLMEEVKQSLSDPSSAVGGDTRAVFLDRGRRRPYFLQGHGGDVTATAVSVDSRIGLTASKDGSIKLWRLQPCCTEMATLMSFKDAWTVVSPDGRFETNNFESASGVAWVSSDDPLRALPLEVFMKDYYRPRLLPQILGGTLPKLAPPEQRNRVLPVVAVSRVAPEPGNNGRVAVTISVALQNKGSQTSGAQELRLFRDGRMVRYWPTVDAAEVTAHDVALPSGDRPVVFSAYAFNSGGVKSLTGQTEYRPQPSAAASHPRAFLLNIGVNRTKDSSCALHYSVADAKAFSAALDAPLRHAGYDVQPTILTADETDPDGAGRDRIEASLKKISANATPDDLVLISFSGHGYSRADGQFFLLPSSVEGSCDAFDEKMLTGAISADQLTDWLRPLDAGEIVLIIDACHSAAGVEGRGGFNPGPMGSPGLGQLAYDKKIRILVASQANQTAQETDALGMGFLSFALTKDGLGKLQADWKPADGRIFLREWLQWGVRRVPQLYESLARGTLKADFTERGGKQLASGAHRRVASQTPALFDFGAGDDGGAVLAGDPPPAKAAPTTDKDAPKSGPKARLEMDAESGINALAISPDGKVLATASSDSSVYLWDLASGKKLQEFVGHRGSVNKILYAPKGKLIITGSSGVNDKSIRMWDVASGEDRRHITGLTIGTTGLAMSPDGLMVAIGDDRHLHLWGMVEDKEVGSADEDDIIRNIAFSPDGKFLAVALDSNLDLRKPGNGDLIRKIKTNGTFLSFFPDGKRFLTGGSELGIYDLDRGRLLAHWPGRPKETAGIGVFSADGRLVAVAFDSGVSILDASDGREIQRVETPGLLETMAFSPDGKFLVTGGSDKIARVWEIGSK